MTEIWCPEARVWNLTDLTFTSTSIQAVYFQMGWALFNRKIGREVKICVSVCVSMLFKFMWIYVVVHGTIYVVKSTASLGEFICLTQRSSSFSVVASKMQVNFRIFESVHRRRLEETFFDNYYFLWIMTHHWHLWLVFIIKTCLSQCCQQQACFVSLHTLTQGLVTAGYKA